MKVGICGIGQFGYAILKHLDTYKSDKYDICAYDINTDVISHIKKNKTHLYLYKDVKIGERISFSDNLKQLVENSDILVLSVTSDAIRDLVIQIKDSLKDGVILLNTAKALDNKDAKTISTIISEELGNFNYEYAAFGGGTIASDLFSHEPLGADIACKSEQTFETLKQLFNAPTLKVYHTTDILGVEYAGAFKNVISIFAGIVNGLGLSYGSETHFISRASANIKKLVVGELGGQEKTFSMESQCWGNDYWMSCTGNTRNRRFGYLIGQGNSTQDAIEIMRQEHKSVEGINTLNCLMKLISDNSRYPILSAVHDIVINDTNPKDTIHNLMTDDEI